MINGLHPRAKVLRRTLQRRAAVRNRKRRGRACRRSRHANAGNMLMQTSAVTRNIHDDARSRSRPSSASWNFRLPVGIEVAERRAFFHAGRDKGELPAVCVVDGESSSRKRPRVMRTIPRRSRRWWEHLVTPRHLGDVLTFVF